MGDIYSEEGDPDSLRLFPEVSIVLVFFMIFDRFSKDNHDNDNHDLHDDDDDDLSER